MKQLLRFIVVGLALLAPQTATATISIFACEPEWAALAKEIGGDKVKVFSATTARQDPHYIRARPSLIAKVRKADLLLCSGASLEVGWLPILLQKGNRHIQPGTIGYLMAADIVPLLEKPASIDRSQGDVHPEGNPHLHLNPYHMLTIAKELANRLDTIDEDNSGTYQQHLNDFSERWKTAITRWETQATLLKGKSVVVHHKSFSYLLDWLGINVIASLEPKPGIPATMTHLEKLLQQLQGKQADMILRTPYDPSKASKWLAKKTGITPLILPYTVGGDKHSTDLFALFDRTITLMTEGL